MLLNPHPPKTKQNKTKIHNIFSCIYNDLVSSLKKLAILLWFYVYHSRDGALYVICICSSGRDDWKPRISIIHLVDLESPYEEQVKEAVKAQSVEEQIKQRHHCVFKYLKNCQAQDD